MPKRKNIPNRAEAIKNIRKLIIKFNLIINHLFKILAFILASSIGVGFYNKIRNFFLIEQTQDQLIPNEDHLEEFPGFQNQLIPCGSNLEEFIPKKSICYMTTKLSLNKDCEGVGNVSPRFAQVNGYAYAAGCCKFLNIPIEKCSINMRGIISSIKLAKQIELSKELVGIRLVEEGKYAIVDFKQTVATVGISFCVGVAITSLNNPIKVLLAHVSAENIIANDYYLKGTFADPFVAIKNFIATSKFDDWRVTIVGGHIENIVYIKTVLENMGLNNIDSYYESSWSVSFSKNNELNQGSIVIQEGEHFIIKNSQDFKHLFVTIPVDQKNNPVALKLQETPELIRSSRSKYTQ